MAELYYYISYQAQIKCIHKWRIVRVWNGEHRTAWYSSSKEAAEKFMADLPTSHPAWIRKGGDIVRQ